MRTRLGRARPNRPIILTTPAPFVVVSGDPVVYRIDGPRKKWRISMATDRVDGLSREEVDFDVAADNDGKPYNVTAATARAAFLPDSHAKPSESDWKACTWNTTLIGTFVARCLVGPGGTVQLTAGKTYFTWVQITNTPTNELVVRQTGRLIVE